MFPEVSFIHRSDGEVCTVYYTWMKEVLVLSEG